jgi:S-DNA-T family DNA segregation ATPase FtsK/SpoIIIE
VENSLAQAETKKTAATGLSPVRRGLNEVVLIALIAFCIYLTLALFSYSATDPGWSYTGSTSEAENLVGRSGAWFADVLLFLFGFFAFLFPALLAHRCWLLFRERKQPHPFSWIMLLLRLSGLLLTLAAGSGIASMHFYVSGQALPAGSGGILGKTLVDILIPAFSYVGSTLLLLSVFLIGITVATEISWLKVMDATGNIVLDLIDKLVVGGRKFGIWRKNRAEVKLSTATRRSALAAQEQKNKTRVPLKIEKVAPKPEVSVRVEREKQGTLFRTKAVNGLPAIHLLDASKPEDKRGYSEEDLEAMSRLLELKLKDYGVIAEVVAVFPGPVITRFEIQPAAGVKVSRITGLAKDLARSLAVISVRVVEVIPGKAVVGIEIPNVDRQLVHLSEVISSATYDRSKSPLTLVLGDDIAGQPVVVDLAKMPHLLVAGTTGSGKSVGLNAMILSILFKANPQEVRLIMVDPKMLELAIYEGIPHLLTPVVTDMKDAANALRWCVAEMERRYRLMASLGVRNIGGFNRKVREAEHLGTPLKDPLWIPDPGLFADEEVDPDQQAPDLETLPFIVVVIDEFADMMMIVGKKVEELIARIAQKARAAGIHLILATQRPSVDVITGLIKANIPTRIGFQVSSRVDSRTILDQGGAEQLLGHGDMLYLPAGSPIPVRVHGAFVSDEEVHRVVDSWREIGEPDYLEEILERRTDADVMPGLAVSGSEEVDGEEDPLYDEAVQIVTESRRASISSVQRKLRIGYNRAARIIETMEQAGVVTEMNSNGSREVIAPPPPSS